MGPSRPLVIADLRADPTGRSTPVVNVMRQRGDHVDLSLPEAADRLAIRELIDVYAYCADRRDVAGQLALFTEDAELVVLPTAEILS